MGTVDDLLKARKRPTEDDPPIAGMLDLPDCFKDQGLGLSRPFGSSVEDLEAVEAKKLRLGTRVGNPAQLRRWNLRLLVLWF